MTIITQVLYAGLEVRDVEMQSLGKDAASAHITSTWEPRAAWTRVRRGRFTKTHETTQPRALVS
jgi:hypothetical protein